MSGVPENTDWQLEDFVDSLVVELDKTRETLAVKAINKPLSYTVKEVALDLNIFPSYDGDQVRFVTAQPGQDGASKLTIALGSITDQQVRATSKGVPGARDDVALEEVPVDRRTKRELRKLGVNTLDDLKELERRNVDLKKVTDSDIDYTALANQIAKTRRDQQAPRVRSVSLEQSAAGRRLVLRGDNLAVDPDFAPVAVVNDELAEVVTSSPSEVAIALGEADRLAEQNEVVLTTDPYAVIRVNVRA